MPQLTSSADVYDRVRTQIGKLARRVEEELTFPSERDEDALKIYLGDALSEIATVTERINTSVQLVTVPGQEYLDRPPHLHVLQEAAVYDGATAYEACKQDGVEVARWSRAPDADTGRPTHIGAYDDRLYFWPIPDTEYTVDLQATHNGAVADNGNPPAGPQDPPELDTVVAKVPPELDRALAGYVTAEWLKETGTPDAGQEAAERFVRDIRRHKHEPVHDSTATRPYRPLGF
jgi:hypothetical protein